jgi:hypothetical protein
LAQIEQIIYEAIALVLRDGILGKYCDEIFLLKWNMKILFYRFL